VLIPRSALGELEAALRASSGGLRVAAVDADVDPLELARAGAGAFGSAVFFSSPAGQAVGGLGVSWAAEAAGWRRFVLLDRALRDSAPAGVQAVLGFSFTPDRPGSPEWAGFPAATVVVPQIAVWQREGRSRLSVAVPAGVNPAAVLATAAMLRRAAPPEVPEAAEASRPVLPTGDWVGRVARTVAAIRSGGPAKVVLARARRVLLERAAEPFDVVAALRERCPDCYAYGWRVGGAALVGASPELLVSRWGGRFETRPLAGSAPRGADPEGDRRLGDGLAADAKERAEHAFVVEEVAAHLAALADTIDRPPGPRLERFAGVQHLATPIGGTTRARLLELVGVLHPTAAVGGVPRSRALAYIDEVEGMDRGWYAGGVGWAGPGGDGEVAVALRCALLRGEEALVYAGAGIVAGSDPAAEAAETDLKMGSLLEVFRAG
jgi:isochorismate synthase